MRSSTGANANSPRSWPSSSPRPSFWALRSAQSSPANISDPARRCPAFRGNWNTAAATDLDARLTVTKAGGQAISGYFTEIVAKCRTEPNRRPGQPLDRLQGGGARLSDDELLDILFLMLIAGLDTVSDSLTCFFAFLATHPDHRRQIAADPLIIPAAVEELLRWKSSRFPEGSRASPRLIAFYQTARRCEPAAP